jgi:hypothetical protein
MQQALATTAGRIELEGLPEGLLRLAITPAPDDSFGGERIRTKLNRDQCGKAADAITAWLAEVCSGGLPGFGPGEPAADGGERNSNRVDLGGPAIRLERADGREPCLWVQLNLSTDPVDLTPAYAADLVSALRVWVSNRLF